MAQILPTSLTGATTPEVARMYQLLRRLPDKEYYVWQRLSLWEQPGPDFWVLNDQQRAVLIKVSAATKADIKATLQPSLLAPAAQTEVVGQSELETLQRFLAELNCATEPGQLPIFVAFPNLSQNDLAGLETRCIKTAFWLTSDQLSPRQFPDWLAGKLGSPLTPDALVALRQAFTPEVVIPATFTTRSPIERHTDAELTEHLLDYRQELLLKTDLDLTAPARAAANDFSIRLVNGVAGSGKSLIVIYRAHLLRQLFPHKKILVLTHNRPLIRDLRSRYERLSAGDHSVTWYTFMGWCRRFWPAAETWQDTVGMRQRDHLIQAAWAETLADTSFTAQMLADEIDWIKDRLLFNREDYLAGDRSGRGFALNESMRQRVFDALQHYQRALNSSGLQDWGDVPRAIWRHLETGRFHAPIYDVILVDEAQFFAPLWFEIIKRRLKPGSGHLFMVADPSQGFLRRRQSWQASGLNVRGRSHHLSKSYRTTRQILNFATLLYRTRLPDDDEAEEIVVPDLLDMPNGALPVLIPLSSPQDEATRILNEIRGLAARGISLGHILVIHADYWEVDKLISRLQKEFGQAAVIDPGQVRDSQGCLRVCSLHAATGLEAPIVFLLGTHALYEQEQSLRLGDEERRDLIRDNTRKLYMACTRAGEHLILTYVGEVPQLLRRLLAPQDVI
ncbi:MAG: DEAD/DEAH box helicase [Anaerolineales bacterium]|nr:DEAD/DEAH box helicase [Anaerolineales bacterium]